MEDADEKSAYLRYSLSFYNKNDESSDAAMCLYDSDFERMVYDMNTAYYSLEAGKVYYAANHPWCDVEYRLIGCAFSVEAVPSIKVSGATDYVVYQKTNNKWKSIGTTKATSYINRKQRKSPS